MSNQSVDLATVRWPGVPFPLAQHLILAGLRGSSAHGTWIAPTDPQGIDDVDILGVCIPPPAFHLGIRTWTHAEAIQEQWDVVLYGLQKFIGLLCQQNPNSLCLLWLDPGDYFLVTPIGRRLIEHRMLFRSRQRAFDCIMGYAHGQLKRMVSFGAGLGYMGAKRKALVEKFGLDTKNASHLIRLLHMGYEYLTTGELQVRRTTDAAHLIAIKRGEVSREAIEAEAEEYFQKCREALATSPLPEEYDMDAINALSIGCHLDAWVMGPL